MSEELATAGVWGLETKVADESLAALQKSNFLPRLQFISKMSKFVEIDPAIPVNHFALIASDEEYKDLGSTVDVQVLSWRQKALDTGAGKSYYNHQTEEFLEIQERSNIEQNSGCLYGPEYLVYIPEIDALATLFFGSKSLRFEVRKIQKLYEGNQPVTMTSKVIEPKNGSKPYTCATPKPCATPIAKPNADRMTEIMKEIEKFNNPKSSQTDVEEEGKDAAPTTDRVR